MASNPPKGSLASMLASGRLPPPGATPAQQAANILNGPAGQDYLERLHAEIVQPSESVIEQAERMLLAWLRKEFDVDLPIDHVKLIYAPDAFTLKLGSSARDSGPEPEPLPADEVDDIEDERAIEDRCVCWIMNLGRSP
jgi:hypothetical protein